MSNSVNQVLLSGAVGRDPEIRSTSTGSTVAAFSMASSESHKDVSGAWVETTLWSNCKAFGRWAELVRDRVKKGTRVFIEGKLTEESWNDKTSGAKKSKIVIVANYISVMPTARTWQAEQEAEPDRRLVDVDAYIA